VFTCYWLLDTVTLPAPAKINDPGLLPLNHKIKEELPLSTSYAREDGGEDNCSKRKIFTPHQNKRKLQLQSLVVGATNSEELQKKVRINPNPYAAKKKI